MAAGTEGGVPARAPKALSARKRLLSIFDCCPNVLLALSVAYFAMFGLALRVGIALLFAGRNFGLTTTSAGGGDSSLSCLLSSSASGYFLQNCLGCVLMASIARHKTCMHEVLAVGLGTGLCGSLTTFATWMVEEGKTVVNGEGFLALVSLFCMLCASLASYRFGHHVAGCGVDDDSWVRHRCCVAFQDLVYRKKPKDDAAGLELAALNHAQQAESGQEPAGLEKQSEQEGGGEASEAAKARRVDTMDWNLAMDQAKSWHTPELKLMLTDRFQVLLVVLSAVGIALYAYYCHSSGYTQGLWHLAFAPLGALLRWILSWWNPWAQKTWLGFPAFTLAANILACAVSAWATTLALRSNEEGRKHILSAVGTGFAGCLSTVSTLMGELRNESLGGVGQRSAYLVVSCSLAIAVVLPILDAC